MRAGQLKSRTTWASLVCLASVGCVHQQQTTGPKRPLASSQSGRAAWQQAGLTSNTGRVAVVNDPSQWPKKPSEAAVKSQFSELFPTLAQRQDGAARVQIGPPQTVAEAVDVPIVKAVESAQLSEALPQEAEARTEPQPASRPEPEQPVKPLDGRLLARLSQQSAGAISAVAAMASMPAEAPAETLAKADPPEEPKKTAEPEAVQANLKPSVINALPHKSVVAKNDSANRSDQPAEQTQVTSPIVAGMSQPTPAANAPSVQSAQKVEALPSAVVDKSLEDIAKQKIVEIMPAEVSAPATVQPIPVGQAVKTGELAHQPVLNKEITAEKPLSLPSQTVAQQPVVPAEDLPAVPAIPEAALPAGVADGKPSEKNGFLEPKLTSQLPGLEAMPARDVSEKGASTVLKDQLEPPAPLPVVPAIPTVPVLTSIPEQAKPIAQVPVKESLPPPLTADEVLARQQGKATQDLASAETEPTSQGKAIESSALPASLPGIPALVDEKQAKPQEATAKISVPETAAPIAEERLALAPAEKPVSTSAPMLTEEKPIAGLKLVEESNSRIKPQVEMSQTPQLKQDELVATVPDTPAGSKPEKLQEPANAGATQKNTIDLPPPAPAPELQVPGLPATLTPPGGINGDGPRVAPSADQGVERSSVASPSEPKLSQPTALVEPEPAPEKAADSNVNQNKQIPSAKEAEVPVLTPLPDDQAARKVSPFENRSREIVIRFTLPKPSLGKLFSAKTQSENSIKGLRTAASGMFDWRKRFSPTVMATARAADNAVGQPAEALSQNNASPSKTEASVAEATPPTVATKPSFAVEPFRPVNLSQNGLPPVTFPSSYQQKPSANPWANHVSPAVDLVAMPPVPDRNPQVISSNDVAMVQAQPVSRRSQPLGDSGIIPISFATLTKSAEMKKSPVAAPVAVPTAESHSWISRAGQGLRSLWGGSDEVVPPRRQDWASRVAAIQNPTTDQKSGLPVGASAAPERTAAPVFKPLQPPGN